MAMNQQIAREVREEQQVSPDARWQIHRALKRYEAQVTGANLAEDTKKTYLTHARNFTRWLEGKFVPGGTRE